MAVPFTTNDYRTWFIAYGNYTFEEVKTYVEGLTVFEDNQQIRVMSVGFRDRVMVVNGLGQEIPEPQFNTRAASISTYGSGIAKALHYYSDRDLAYLELDHHPMDPCPNPLTLSGELYKAVLSGCFIQWKESTISGINQAIAELNPDLP